jgi:hypothetical protein
VLTDVENLERNARHEDSREGIVVQGGSQAGYRAGIPGGTFPFYLESHPLRSYI